MKRLALIAVALVVGLIALGALTSQGQDESSRPGSPAVYSRIEASTDCDELQGEFNIAMDNADRRQSGDPLRDASISYAKAADTRMKDLGCYG